MSAAAAAAAPRTRENSIGILGYDSFHFVVENLDRSRQFYTRRFGFKEVAKSSQELTERTNGAASATHRQGYLRAQAACLQGRGYSVK